MPKKPGKGQEKTIDNHVRFEGITAESIQNAAFLIMTQCGSCKNRRFGGTVTSIIKVTRIDELGRMFYDLRFSRR
jgi:hypothetical protein